MKTVIIPVYNCSNYLPACLDSIRYQSCSDWECIIIDDGSDDGSSAIVDHWANVDHRFIVIHQQNAGVSAARNVGISHAKGDLIFFIDGDDRVEPDYLEQLAKPMANPEIDLTVCGIQRNLPDGQVQSLSYPNTSFEIGKEGESIFVGLNEKFLLFAPYSKVYRRSFVQEHRILFDESCSYGEDLKFNYLYLELVKKICVLSSPLYHYRYIADQSLSQKVRADKFDLNYSQWRLLREFHQKHDMWSSVSKDYLYGRLWGLIYDGIFLYPHIRQVGTGYLKNILSIAEIDELPGYKCPFTCPSWIRNAILRRDWRLFYFRFCFLK